MEKELKWGTIIPLIGGSAIGCKKSAGNEPAFHLSYDAFAANESHIEKYWPEVPMYRLDHEDLDIPKQTFNEVECKFSMPVCRFITIKFCKR